MLCPFDPMEDPDLDWVVDGFVEDITTRLSGFRDLFVVARNSAFFYRQAPRDQRIVSRELVVPYVVEYSMRDTRSAAHDRSVGRGVTGRTLADHRPGLPVPRHRLSRIAAAWVPPEAAVAQQ